MEKDKMRTVWVKEKKGDLIEALNSSIIQDRLNAAMTCIDDNIETALELLINSLCRASNCMKKQFSRGFQCKHALWFDTDCCKTKKCEKRKR